MRLEVAATINSRADDCQCHAHIDHRFALHVRSLPFAVVLGHSTLHKMREPSKTGQLNPY